MYVSPLFPLFLQAELVLFPSMGLSSKLTLGLQPCLPSGQESSTSSVGLFNLEVKARGTFDIDLYNPGPENAANIK